MANEWEMHHKKGKMKRKAGEGFDIESGSFVFKRIPHLSIQSMHHPSVPSAEIVFGRELRQEQPALRQSHQRGRGTHCAIDHGDQRILEQLQGRCVVQVVVVLIVCQQWNNGNFCFQSNLA